MNRCSSGHYEEQGDLGLKEGVLGNTSKKEFPEDTPHGNIDLNNL